jgi:hypothetical protein
VSDVAVASDPVRVKLSAARVAESVADAVSLAVLASITFALAVSAAVAVSDVVRVKTSADRSAESDAAAVSATADDNCNAALVNRRCG